MKNFTPLPGSPSGEEGAATAEYAIATTVAMHVRFWGSASGTNTKMEV